MVPAQVHHDVVPSAAATVLTLEGGLVGLQNVLRFTQLQLRGDLCDKPNTCKPVNYFAMPLGQFFNDQGAVKLNQAIGALPDDGAPVILYGHSQGGQVIYSALRGWAAKPATAPDPSRVSWVSIGNPENTFGGKDPDPIPADSPYQGTEVIRQYDGWADWPTDQRNLLAVLNAVIGMNTVHPFYFNVDLNDPKNLRYVEGNVTYVFVPNPVLPLVQAAAGPLAPLLNPVLDPILRPMVEAGYQRPVGANPGSARAVAAESAAQVVPDRIAEQDVLEPTIVADTARAALTADLGPSPASGPATRRGVAAAVAEEGAAQAASPRTERRAAAGGREGRRG